MVTAVLCAALFSLASLLRPLQTLYSAPQATTRLYDSSLGNTLGEQNFEYQAIGFPALASQTYSAPVNILNTDSQLNDYAGNTVTPTAMPTLSRAAGFRLTFDLRVVAEEHNGNDNRAGFNVILLSEDLYGVELAFWEEAVWVQEGNGNQLFTRAEGILHNTTTALTRYELSMHNAVYLLTANGVPLLSGNLRQYTDWEPPTLLLPDPYEVSNQLFLGDNTSSAGALVWLGDVSISTDITPTVSVAETAVSLPETITQTSLAVTLSAASPLTVTVQYSLSSGTATAGQDFVASSGTLTFTPGSLSQTISITLLPDDLPEPDETFTLQLFNVENGILGEDTAVFTIQDDDALAYTLFLPYLHKP